MGIAGLHEMVASIARPVHLSDFAGEQLAVDASAWLHRGAISCALELAAGTETDAFLNYPRKMLDAFLHHGVRPYLVFDGAALPLKLGRQRQAARAAARLRGLDCLRRADLPAARAAFAKCVGATAWMARALADELRARGLPFVVAPSEADAQLAFLVRSGECAAAVSDDSDLLPYGCPRCLFKLDASGSALLVVHAELRYAQRGGSFLFDGTRPGEWEAWVEGKLVLMCVLAGCDYLPSLSGVGLRTAHAAVRANGSVEHAVRALLPRAREPPACVNQYIAQVKQAIQVFKHAYVFDPQTQRVAHLTPMPPGTVENIEHLGTPLSASLARKVCVEASLDPRTLQPHEKSAHGCAEDSPASLQSGAPSAAPEQPPRASSSFFSDAPEAGDLAELIALRNESQGQSCSSNSYSWPLPPPSEPEAPPPVPPPPAEVAGLRDEGAEGAQAGACDEEGASDKAEDSPLSLLIDYSAWSGWHEVLLRLLRDPAAPLARPSRLWLLYASLHAALPPDASTLTAAQCDAILPPALLFLRLLAPWARQWEAADAASHRCYVEAQTSLWRQAALQPLRGTAIDWVRLGDVADGVPAEARAELHAELRRLVAPCGCAAAQLRSLRLATCGQPYTCAEVSRRVRSYSARHTPRGALEPLRRLLPRVVQLLPAPALHAAAVEAPSRVEALLLEGEAKRQRTAFSPVRPAEGLSSTSGSEVELATFWIEIEREAQHRCEGATHAPPKFVDELTGIMTSKRRPRRSSAFPAP
ncbi:hypothetical protein AB1Y20_014876 [Prymnesium parvum]|uniref:Exonuclease 1 n=1 Tax=Prymnesium parvum TaxID=97485 RepID=A0AB34JZ00_PRYPA